MTDEGTELPLDCPTLPQSPHPAHSSPRNFSLASWRLVPAPPGGSDSPPASHFQRPQVQLGLPRREMALSQKLQVDRHLSPGASTQCWQEGLTLFSSQHLPAALGHGPGPQPPSTQAAPPALSPTSPKLHLMG